MKHPIRAKPHEKSKVELCREKREVKTCEECLRYEECFKGKVVDWHIQDMLRLANEIVVDIGNAYCECWKNGQKSQFYFYRNLLLTTYVQRITGNQTDGEALENILADRCLKKYGTFESCFEKRIAKYTRLIAEQKDLLKKTRDVKKRKIIRNKIYRLEGEMYE